MITIPLATLLLLTPAWPHASPLATDRALAAPTSRQPRPLEALDERPWERTQFAVHGRRPPAARPLVDHPTLAGERVQSPSRPQAGVSAATVQATRPAALVSSDESSGPANDEATATEATVTSAASTVVESAAPSTETSSSVPPHRDTAEDMTPAPASMTAVAAAAKPITIANASAVEADASRREVGLPESRQPAREEVEPPTEPLRQPAQPEPATAVDATAAASPEPKPAAMAQAGPATAVDATTDASPEPKPAAMAQPEPATAVDATTAASPEPKPAAMAETPAADTEGYRCSNGEVERRVEIRYESQGSKLPCEVYYTTEYDPAGKRLWRSSSQRGFCQNKSRELASKLEGWGWNCSTS